MDNLIYEIDGNMGQTLKVYEDKCIISSKKGLKSIMFGNALSGDKQFYYTDITSVQFKNLGIASGYLQFEYAGSHSGNNFTSENSFVFSATIGTSKYKKLKEEMPGIYEDIRNRIDNAKTMNSKPVINAVSPADELKKYKELFDSNIITQEEFEAKKKQILGF